MITEYRNEEEFMDAIKEERDERRNLKLPLDIALNKNAEATHDRMKNVLVKHEELYPHLKNIEAETMNSNPDKPMRFNEGKPELSYVLTFGSGLKGMCETMTYGAKKYSEYNYIKPADSQQHVDSLMRHLLSWFNGEDIDPGSMINHLHHVSFNALRLATEMENGTLKDNRPHKVLGK